jgi:hypothetical protein
MVQVKDSGLDDLHQSAYVFTSAAAYIDGSKNIGQATFVWLAVCQKQFLHLKDQEKQNVLAQQGFPNICMHKALCCHSCF